MVITMKINVKGFKAEIGIRIHADSISEVNSRLNLENISKDIPDKSEDNSDVKMEGLDIDIPVSMQMDEASLEMDAKEINEMFHDLNKSITDTIRNEMKAAAAADKKED